MAGRTGTDESIRGPGYVGLRQNIAALNERPPFTVGATLDISACAGFVLQISDEEKTVQKEFDLMTMDITQIQSMCVPSAFNDLIRKEWRVDPSVRLAMECPAERMKILSRDSEHSFESIFQDVLRDDLLMSTYSNIEMLPNKLNIYSKGGHFTAHKDSSRVDPDRYLGTLIVALHSAHTGGELYVRNEGQETVYDFSQRSADSNIVQFAAFIGDCEHEVKPVTSGHRVVLTYTLLRPTEDVLVLPSPAILIFKTVSKPYISASAAVPVIPVIEPVVVKTEVVSHSISAPVYHSGGGLFGDGDDFGYDYGDYDHDCNED
uniref:Fe2OG dioxygenase domain-containing protein n=1 Tax=Spumella elongata TaxID=89044 RepID=A0A7S3H9W2_9STRA|mmetsp:Transcript_41778/g.72509  ORF Transcript_41778/g.72509 Transcript_41778/m.72509 type:complete len:319 (+) Transcript_41778:43-999(+)|eukprot:CAMPEP_0184972870 /NCGR_PEP_ID=MMETSP1098-20130426/4812_1 /TAXON_ID=89044 /ORGANISM="Spumella elongata, Strain CCAP 955/1" /LENGTH=318 /DNA_ID=CAMNT_0027495257 /DNA_START=42 /DNA_END=998 /DNA_ORIENTATION=+